MCCVCAVCVLCVCCPSVCVCCVCAITVCVLCVCVVCLCVVQSEGDMLGYERYMIQCCDFMNFCHSALRCVCVKGMNLCREQLEWYGCRVSLWVCG